MPHSRQPPIDPTPGPIVGAASPSLEDSIGALVVVVGERGEILGWNRECEIVTGQPSCDVRGRSATAVLFGVNDDVEQSTARFFSATRDGPCLSRIVRSVRTRGGERKDFVWERRRLDRKDCRYVLTGMQLPERGRDGMPRTRRQGFLALAGQTLAASLEHAETVRTIMRLVTRELAAACVLELVEADDTFRTHAEHRDLTKRPLMRRLCGRGSRRSSRIFRFPAVRAEESVLWSNVVHEELCAVVHDDDDVRTLTCLPLSSLLVVPLCARGRPLGTLALLSEHPERCFDEDDLRLAEDFAREAAFAIDNACLYQSAREAVLTRDQVLETVAHDLRNPLGEIVLAVELLASNGPDAAGVAARVRRSAGRMQRMIRDLLDVKEIEGGCLQLERSAIALARLVQEACGGVAEQARRRGIDVRIAVPDDLPAIDVDADRILQVLGNLLDNALKFTPSGGRIDVIGRAHARSVGLLIVDTGPGIPADELAHVFDRFYHRSRSRGGGNGLGLAISKALVEAHGGRIMVSNAKPHGAVFRLTLPIAKNEG